MRRNLINALAVIGAITVLGSLAGFVLRRYADGTAKGIVLGQDHKPLVGAPVFLDRGRGAIERYETDSQGRFTLPVQGEELHRAKWLICVPGGIPLVDYTGDPYDIKIGPTTYSFTRHPTGKPAFICVYGWLGPVPHECPPALDSVVWRYPPAAGKDPGAGSYTEPDWNQYKR
jgi:hypothetical protein